MLSFKVCHSHRQELTDNTKTTKTILVERMQEEKTKDWLPLWYGFIKEGLVYTLTDIGLQWFACAFQYAFMAALRHFLY